jgi:hypothetical protein
MKFSVGSNGEAMRIQSNKNILIGTTTDNGAKLQVNGSATFAGSLTMSDYINHTGDSGTKFGFSANDTFVVRTGGAVRLTVNDTSSTFAGSLNGTTGQFTGIGVSTAPSAVYKLDVNGKARVQSVLELEDVLTLNAISTPADPAIGKSSIWMATSGDIKVKINVAGNVVTKTIVSYE